MPKSKSEDDYYSIVNSMEKFVSQLILDAGLMEEEKEDMLYVPN